MTKWQYKVVIGGYIYENGNRVVINKEEALNNEGKDGWELVSVTREDVLHETLPTKRRGEALFYYKKRPAVY